MAVVARVVLGLVFLGSGALKLRDPQWPPAARALGVPSFAVGAVAPTEIVLGALLVAGVASWVMPLVALVALGGFTAVLARALLRPVEERPRCACFGRWSARPVNSWSLIRNLGFGVLGVLALVG